MEFMSAKDASVLWGISQRRVALLCSEKRIEGAEQFGNMWAIPKTASKPSDPRKISDDDVMKPVVIWAGGKRQLLDRLNAMNPKSFNRYFEPFVGGGAFFLELAHGDSVINDINPELIAIYRCLKNEILYKKLIEKLDEYTLLHNASSNMEAAAEFFYSVRNLDKSSEYSDFEEWEKAARALYLNKTCFNGLYRVNSKGFFNVPFANKQNIVLYSKKNLDSIHEYLSCNNVEILNGDYHDAVKKAKAGDFVYFDPPYDKLKKDKDTHSFTSYSKEDFGENEQKSLAVLFRSLSDKGVFCMLSNHNTVLIQELYKDFNIHIVHANRLINSRVEGRGPVEEVIITNYIQE